MTHRTILPGSIIQPSLGEPTRPDIAFHFDNTGEGTIEQCLIGPAAADLAGWREVEEKCPELLTERDEETGYTLAEHLDLYRVRLASMRVRIAIQMRRWRKS